MSIDWEEKKEDDDDEKEMEGNRRDDEYGGGYDSQIPLCTFCHFCSSCFKVISSMKKLNNHIVHKPKDPTSWIIWWLPRHQTTCHSPPCPVCQSSVTTVARTFQASPSSLSKHMFVVHGASRPSKILQDRYLAELMARKRISVVICYIPFKTRISFKKHI